jgi:tetratricopeptide (TPR) repeat protein
MPFARGCALAAVLLAVSGGCASRQPLITKLVDGKLITTRSISPRAYEHAARALLYEEEERWQEAVDEYKLALGYDPESPELYARLSQAYLELDEVKLAQTAVDRSLAIEPTPDGIVASAHVHLHRGNPKAAARVLGDALLRMRPDDNPMALERLTLERADAQVMALDLKGATATLDALLAQSPALPSALYRQACIVWPLGDFPAARRYLVRLIEVEPDHIEARLLLARLLTMMNEATHARDVYADAFARAEGDLAVAGLYATFLLTQGMQEEAQALQTIFKSMLPIPRRSPRAWNWNAQPDVCLARSRWPMPFWPPPRPKTWWDACCLPKVGNYRPRAGSARRSVHIRPFRREPPTAWRPGCWPLDCCASRARFPRRRSCSAKSRPLPLTLLLTLLPLCLPIFPRGLTSSSPKRC